MAALDLGSWASVFRSKPFVFVVGENRAAFPVHAAVIAKQSKALDVLINGPMGEASKGEAIFEDIEEDTFIRFCQFAYTGDYATPDFTHIPSIELPDTSTPEILPHDASAPDRDSRFIEPEWEPTPEPEPEALEAQPADDFGWGSTVKEPKKPKKPKKPSKSSLLRQSLHNQLYDTETIRTILEARCEVRQNSDLTENYTAVFLGHAQLYVFADKWGIESLKTLALFKLHRTLTTFTLYSARRPDIVELLRYTFSNDHTPDLVDGVDDLRSLVMLYTACEVESLIHCPEFLSLIGEGGQLAQNLVQILMKRIG
ncbi:hypothetical protein LCER1_G007636 [Lachnellula cervina]|uniref:BTB domain-containing protein n=1 Tax=Lachnellula cervina TaxID=1316786 RepID=A0A7D8YZF5_9HELO|nr:hypothetical protein LCER1_G007636 [Lachnellula cervina]